MTTIAQETVTTPRQAKRLPNRNELAFIHIASKIKDGRIDSRQAIRDAVSGTLQDIALALFDAYIDPIDNSTIDFWKAYESQTVDYPSLHEWRELVKVPAAPDDQPAAEEQDKRFVKTAEGKRLLKLSTIDDIYGMADAEYLIHKILEEATVSLLYGVSGTGKTFTALDMALSVAHGLYWHGRKTKEGTVWFINTEGGRGLKKRLKAWYIEHSDLAPSPNFKIIPWALDLREHLQELLDTLSDVKEKPVLIVLDNFSMCVSSVDQNKQEQVSPVLRDLHAIANEYGSHLMLIHHTNKEGDFNGSQAFRNHVDAMIELRKEDKADKHSPIIFTSQKSRDDENFKDIRTKLKSIEISYDEDNQDFVTSCVTVPCEPSESKQWELRDIEQDVLDLLANRYMAYTEWQELCVKELKISSATFSRVKKVLESKAYVAKGKIEGKKFQGYHALLNESGVSDE